MSKPARKAAPIPKVHSVVPKQAATIVPAKEPTRRPARQRPAADPKPAQKAKTAAKLTGERASEHFADLGRRGGLKLAAERGPAYYSAIAKQSHPRDSYKGGRPKGSKTKKTA